MLLNEAECVCGIVASSNIAATTLRVTRNFLDSMAGQACAVASALPISFITGCRLAGQSRRRRPNNQDLRFHGWLSSSCCTKIMPSPVRMCVRIHEPVTCVAAGSRHRTLPRKGDAEPRSLQHFCKPGGTVFLALLGTKLIQNLSGRLRQSWTG